MNEDEFLERLKKLCFDYDIENGEYVESSYEGHAILRYYLERAKPDNWKHESNEHIQKLIDAGDKDADCSFDE